MTPGGASTAITTSGDNAATQTSTTGYFRRGAIELRYPAKGGIDQEMMLRDPALHAVVR